MQNPTSPGATTIFFQMMILCDGILFFLQAQLLVLVDNLVVSCDVNLFFFFRRNYQMICHKRLIIELSRCHAGEQEEVKEK